MTLISQTKVVIKNVIGESCHMEISKMTLIMIECFSYVQASTPSVVDFMDGMSGISLPLLPKQRTGNSGGGRRTALTLIHQVERIAQLRHAKEVTYPHTILAIFAT